MNIFGLNGLDIIYIVLIAGFTIRGVLRGIIMEVAAIAAFIVGFVVANKYYIDISEHIQFISDSQWRVIASYLIVFIIAFACVNIVGVLLRKAASISLAAWFDHVAGAVVGMIKGLLLCFLLLAIVQVALPDAGFLKESKLTPYMREMMEKGRAALPDLSASEFSLKRFLNI